MIVQGNGKSTFPWNRQFVCFTIPSSQASEGGFHIKFNLKSQQVMKRESAENKRDPGILLSSALFISLDGGGLKRYSWVRAEKSFPDEGKLIL